MIRREKDGRGKALLAALLLAALPAHAIIKSQGGTSGGGGSGTVTSVGASSPDSSLTITGSPITTAGTFTFAVNATNITTGTLPCARLPALSGVVITTSGCVASFSGVGLLPAAQFPSLTGDVTTSAGSVATVLATVNSNVGSFTAANITVNAKGQVTAASNGSAGTGTVTSVNGTSSTLAATGGPITTTGALNFEIPVGGVTDTLGALSNKPSVTVVCDAACGNLALTGVQTVDGQAGTANQTLVLLTAQSTASQNGPWVEQTSAWTRPTWFPSGGTAQALQFSTYRVRLGTLYQGSFWRQTTAMPVTIDATSLAFAISPIALNSGTVSGVAPVANGGTGTASTLTGLVRGNSSAMTAAELSGDASTSGSNAVTFATVNSNVGSFTNTNLTVNGKGLITAASNGTAVPTGANPTALAGLTAVNGSAATFLRSDGAPALDQTIAPTWTGQHTFTASIGLGISSAEPRENYVESDQGADLKNWGWDVQSGVFTGRTRTDADGAGVNWLAVTRGTTTAISNIAFGNTTNNNTFTFNGFGTATFSGDISTGGSQSIGAGRFTVTGTAVPSNGIYRPATNTLGFTANTTQVGGWTTSILNVLTDLSVDTTGKGLQVKEGTNGKQGTCTLVAGTCTVTTTSVTASSRIFLTAQSLGTVAVPSAMAVTARIAATSFVITASAATDTSVVAYEVFEPAP